MSKLFAESYPNNTKGRATMALRRVADTIRLHRSMPMDADTRIGVIIDLHRVQRDDLPDDLQALYDEFASHLGMA